MSEADVLNAMNAQLSSASPKHQKWTIASANAKRALQALRDQGLLK